MVRFVIEERVLRLSHGGRKVTWVECQLCMIWEYSHSTAATPHTSFAFKSTVRKQISNPGRKLPLTCSFKFARC